LQLRSGGSFIVEAAYDAEYENAKWQARQQEYGFSVVQVHCTAPADVLVRRMSERVTNGSRHPGHADAERIEEFRRSLSDERRETLDVDGTVLSHRSTDPGSSDVILHTLVGIDPRSNAIWSSHT
jgi:predicted kinase